MLSVFAILHIHVRTRLARVCVISLRNKFILAKLDSLILLEFFQEFFLFANDGVAFFPSLPTSPFVERILLQCFERRYKDSNRCNSVDSFHTFIVAKRSVSFPYIRVIVECLRVTIVRKGMHNSKNGDIL